MASDEKTPVQAELQHAEKVELADVAPAYDKALERRVVRKLDMNVTALITFLCKPRSSLEYCTR